MKNALLEMENLLKQTYSTEDIFCKTIILHNIQSLTAHFEDLRSNCRFQSANVICLAETWLQKQKDEMIYLENFTSFRKDRSDSYDNSVQVFSKLKNSKGGGVVSYSQIQESAIEINIPVNNIEIVAILLKDNIAIVTVYRPSAQPVDMFLSSMKYVIAFLKDRYEKIIILGDFNEDAKNVEPIQECMSTNGFSQLVTFPTTEGGTTIDHVYVYGIQQNEINVSLLPTYYSYHDAVVVKIKTSHLE